MELFVAHWVHVGGTFREGQAVLVGDDGRIVAVGPEDEVRAAPGAGGADVTVLMDQALLPGTVSAHSHCFQVFLRGWADQPRSFQDWVSRCLYPLVERLDDQALEASALLCFAQMARAGITTVGEFHYMHNGVEHEERGEELARIVLRAARRVGLRVAFLRAVYDVANRPGQQRFAQPVPRALDGIRRLHQEWADEPAVTVAPAPHSLHGATREAIEGSAALAAELDGVWHIHLAEQEDDVPFARERYGTTPLRALEEWGVLDGRTVLVHGIWLDAGERALLAERGGALVSNPTTNMALGDGIADLPDLLRRGVPVAVGTDMNACPNIFQEMRVAEHLQRVRGLKMGVLAGSGGESPEPARIFDLGTRAGGRALGLGVGTLAPGQWADLLAVSLGDPSLLPASCLGGDALLGALTSGMVAETAICGSWVGGKRIARAGEVIGLSSSDLADAVRASAGFLGPLAEALG